MYSSIHILDLSVKIDGMAIHSSGVKTSFEFLLLDVHRSCTETRMPCISFFCHAAGRRQNSRFAPLLDAVGDRAVVLRNVKTVCDYLPSAAVRETFTMGGFLARPVEFNLRMLF